MFLDVAGSGLAGLLQDAPSIGKRNGMDKPILATQGESRETLLQDLLTLLAVLYAGGPRTIEEVTARMQGTTDAELSDVIDKLAHVNDWLKLS